MTNFTLILPIFIFLLTTGFHNFLLLIRVYDVIKKSVVVQCMARIRYARTRYDFPFTLRFLRNFRKLSIKNTTKLGNSPTRYDFFHVYRNVYAPGTVIWVFPLGIFFRHPLTMYCIAIAEYRTGGNADLKKTNVVYH